MNSSDTDLYFVWFVRRSLAILEDERPEVYRRVAETLTGLRAHIEVQGERFCIHASKCNVAVGSLAGDIPTSPNEAVAPPGTLNVTTDYTSVDAILEGLSVLDAITTDQLRVRGAVDDLLHAGDAFDLYVHGLVRCASSPALFANFRQRLRAKPAVPQSNPISAAPNAA